MATLESLELTIESNAQSAVQGIGSLIRSLSALSTAIGKPVNGLMKLNAELEKLKKYGNIKMPTIGNKVANSSTATNTAKKQIDTAVKNGLIGGYYDPENNNGRGTYNPPVVDPAKEAIYQQKYAEAVQRNKEQLAYRRYMNNFYRERDRLKSLGLFKEDNQGQATPVSEVKEATQAVNEYKEAVSKATEPVKDMSKASDLETAKLDKVKAQTEKLQAQTEKLNAQTEKIRDAAEKGYGSATRPIERVTSAASRLLSRVGRIASTMLIRRAINMMLTGAKEGLDNFYQYSKQVGNSFASTMDNISSKWSQIKNQAGAALGTALQTISPILNTIASLALKAFNALTMLFALLGGKTTYTQATEQANEYASATQSAAGATKDLLASFDELNVIQSTGGGGGGSSIKNVTDAFEEVAIPQWLLEWKPIIEAILGGVLGAIILPKIFDWVKKILALFGLGEATKAFDFLKKLTGTKESDLPPIGKLATETGLYVAAAKLAVDITPQFTEKILALKAALEGISVLSAVLQAIISVLQSFTGQKVKIEVDKKKFDEFKKEFEQFKENSKTLSVAVVFDHTRSSDFWRDKKTIDDWCKAGATKSIAIMTDHSRSSDFSRDKSTIDKWIAATGVKNIVFSVNHTRSADYTRDKKTLDDWLAKTGVKNIAFMVDHTHSSDYTRDRSNLDKWLGTTGIKNIAFMTDHARSSDFSKDKKTIDTWLEKTGIKNVAILFDQTRSSDFWRDKKQVDTWASTTASKYFALLFDHTRSSDFWRDKKTVDTWVNERPSKKIDIMLIDNANGINKVSDWIKKRETKTIDINVNTKKKVNNNGNFFDQNIFTVSINDALNYFKNNDLPTIANDFWESLKRTFGFTSGKDNNNLGMNVSMSVNPDKPSVKGAVQYVESFKPNMQVHTYNTAKDTKATVDAISTWKPMMAVGTYNTAKDVKSTVAAIETWHPNMMVRTYNTYKDTKETVSAIETFVPNMRVNVYNTKKNMEELMAAIETWHPNIVANVTTGETKALAEGGLVESGDLFVANENGKAEMIGRFGNQAAVANQEQMVEAMARGVQYAQAEQNSLLREQNSILRGILQKEGVVKIGASSALGRTVKQSLEMYGALTGG